MKRRIIPMILFEKLALINRMITYRQISNWCRQRRPRMPSLCRRRSSRQDNAAVVTRPHHITCNKEVLQLYGTKRTDSTEESSRSLQSELEERKADCNERFGYLWRRTEERTMPKVWSSSPTTEENARGTKHDRHRRVTPTTPSIRHSAVTPQTNNTNISVHSSSLPPPISPPPMTMTTMNKKDASPLSGTNTTDDILAMYTELRKSKFPKVASSIVSDIISRHSNQVVISKGCQLLDELMERVYEEEKTKEREGLGEKIIRLNLKENIWLI